MAAYYGGKLATLDASIRHDAVVGAAADIIELIPTA